VLLNEEDQTQRCTPDLTSTLPETAQLAVTAQHSLAANSSHNMKGCLSEYTNYTIVVNQLGKDSEEYAEVSTSGNDDDGGDSAASIADMDEALSALEQARMLVKSAAGKVSQLYHALL